ncbi:hotdog domain-containing protein [Streptomyces sp. YKOK-I1]
MSTAALEHYPDCYGCGSGNDRGLGLRMTWQDGSAVGEHTIPGHAAGAPGIAHGGYLAALVDEALALIGMAAAGSPTMTAHVEIDYARPTPVERRLHLRGSVERTSGRRLTAVVEGGTVDGPFSFRGQGILIAVATDRWMEPLHRVYRPERIGSAVVLGLHLEDAPNGTWTLRATPHGLTGNQGWDAELDVVYRGPAEHWHDLSRRRRTLDEVAAHPEVRLDGDTAALRRLVDCLDFPGEAP